MKIDIIPVYYPMKHLLSAKKRNAVTYYSSITRHCFTSNDQGALTTVQIVYMESILRKLSKNDGMSPYLSPNLILSLPGA